MKYRVSWLSLALAPSLVLCGDHDDIRSQFGAARSLRSWDEAYALARVFVSKLDTGEKISLSSGSGISLGPCSGNTQDIDRLGFREMCFQDGPVGVRGTDKVSVFPAGITTGSTWDKELMYLRSRAMGVENRIKGVNVVLTPVAGGLGRAPAAGRNWEAFGSDPYLTGIANAQSVNGLQDEGVIACAKHFIGNEQERYRLVIENLPNLDRPILASISSQIDERTLKELYEWPFIDAVEAGAGSVMCSYQRVNNEYTCESTTILRDHLKSNSSGGLGFRGFVMTDWFASAIPPLAAAAGVDVIMPGDLGATGTVAALMPASDGASQNGTRLDEMVTRLIASWYKMRQDEGFPDVSFSTWSSDEFGVFLDRLYVGQINFHVQAAQPIHKTLIRRIGAEGTTLLKNSNRALPLSNSVASIGVFGNDAGPIPESSCGTFQSCSAGTLAVGWGSGAGTFEYLVDPLQAITAKAAEIGATVESVLDDYAYTEIKQKATGKDVCFAFINSRSGEGTNSVEGNYGDRNNITAWRDGDTLVKTVASSCKNTVVVVHSVGPILMEQWIDNPNVTAVLLAHLPGQESGNSLVDVLWGAVNPSSKLPYTIGKTLDDYCCKVQYAWAGFQPEQKFEEGLLIDYRWFDAKNIQPRFEFGFGLSYTNFTYNANSLTITKLGAVASTDFLSPLFKVSIPITNSGSVLGKEVAQLYLKFPSSTNSPLRQLRGFEKVSLNPGETKTVEFVVTKRDISYWDVSSKSWKVTTGAEYGVHVGASSRDIRAQGVVTF